MSRSSLTIALSLSALALPVHADVVLLDNGDRLSGQVLRLEGDQLKLKLDYGGQLSLPWSAVSAIETSDAVRLVLDDGAVLEGRLSSEQGALVLQNGAEAQRLPPERVAAINPPVAVGGEPVVKQELRANFGASLTRGNTHTETYSLDAEYIARAEQNRLRLGGEANYATDEGERSVNNALAAAQYDHFVNERWYVTGNLNLARDEFRNLELRAAAGLGMGYQFWETERSRLSAELGLNHVYEDYTDGGERQYPAARWGVDWEHILLSALTLFHRQEGYVRLDEADAWLVRTRSGARFPLTERINGTLQINYDYDNSPPEDAKKADSAYLLKLGYEW